MLYTTRHTTRKKAMSAELVCLLVVLSAGVATAWWAGHQIGMNLSGISSVAAALGLAGTGRATHGPVGYDPNALALTGLPDNVAPFCSRGQSPTFEFGLGELKQRLGQTMGTPIECEHVASAAGDTVQQTTTGLAAYKQTSNTVSFTDGWRHWAITPRGFATWEGLASDPPTAANDPAPESR